MLIGKKGKRLMGMTSKQILDTMLDAMGTTSRFMTSRKLGDEFTCPKCGGELEHHQMLLTGPWSGSVACLSCEYRNSIVNYLGSQMFKVEPLPEADGD